MKRLLILLGIIFVTSCSGVLWEGKDSSFDHVQLDTKEEVLEWVANNISYSSVNQENWQLPKETYESRKGDCEDFVILVMYFMREISVPTRLYVIDSPWGAHAVVYIQGVYYEAQKGIEVWYPFTVYGSYDYNQVMVMAYNTN